MDIVKLADVQAVIAIDDDGTILLCFYIPVMFVCSGMWKPCEQLRSEAGT